MREKFSLISRDIDVHRTVAFAALAGKAEVERLLDLFAPPAIANDPIFSEWALGHLPEQMSAAPRRVFFFVRGAVAGAHHAAVFAAALADAHAT